MIDTARSICQLHISSIQVAKVLPHNSLGYLPHEPFIRLPAKTTWIISAACPGYISHFFSVNGG
jgi:hypothetical protein